MIKAYKYDNRFMRFPIYVITNCEYICTYLKIFLNPFLHELDYKLFEKNDYSIEIIKEHNIYVINKKEFIPNNLIFDFLQNYFNENTILIKGYLFMHSAVVEKINTTIALIGESNSGKSTLTTYLYSKGFNFIADDKVIVNVKTKEIYPYINNIILRDESLKILDDYGVEIQTNYIKLMNFKKNILYVNKYSNRRKLDKIIEISLLNNESETLQLLKLNTNDKIKSIILNSYFTSNIAEQLSDAIILAKEIPYYKLFYRDLIEVNEIFLSILM